MILYGPSGTGSDPYVNHFQPSFQLLERTRDGGTVKKRYGTPATPCDRLLWRDDVSEELKTMLRDSRAELDAVSLLHTIREAQSALATINAIDSANVPQSESMERFLSSLPELWRQGEVRPTHAPKKRKCRGIRTQPDPFEGVWCEILDWLQQQPDSKAAQLHDLPDGSLPQPLQQASVADPPAQGSTVAHRRGETTGVCFCRAE